MLFCYLFLGRNLVIRFIKQHKFKFPVEKVCKVLKVSRSGFYNWLNCGPPNSFDSYGSPRMTVELIKQGYQISRPRVARIMRANKLMARRKRKFKLTTDSNHNYPVALGKV